MVKLAMQNSGWSSDVKTHIKIKIIKIFFRKPEEIVHPTDVLTPIDEDLEEGDEEDPDDTPITMGAQIATRAPAITHTAASPSEPNSPSPPEERAQRESVL